MRLCQPSLGLAVPSHLPPSAQATLAFPNPQPHSEPLHLSLTLPGLLSALISMQLAPSCHSDISSNVPSVERPALTTHPVPGQILPGEQELGWSPLDSCSRGQLGRVMGCNRGSLWSGPLEPEAEWGTAATQPPAQEWQLERPSKGVYEDTEKFSGKNNNKETNKNLQCQKTLTTKASF